MYEVATTPFLGLPDLSNAPRDLALLAQRSGLPESVIAGALRGPSAIPTTRTRLSHAYTLRTAQSQVIAAVFRCAVDQTREVELEYENDVNATGQPADIVPQIMSTQTFAITRWDLYTEIMEEALGTRELVMLTDQRRGLRLREVWRAPTSILNSAGRRYEYGPCYFTNVGREVDATNDRTVRANATLTWLRRRRIA